MLSASNRSRFDSSWLSRGRHLAVVILERLRDRLVVENREHSLSKVWLASILGVVIDALLIEAVVAVRKDDPVRRQRRGRTEGRVASKKTIPLPLEEKKLSGFAIAPSVIVDFSAALGDGLRAVGGYDSSVISPNAMSGK